MNVPSGRQYLIRIGMIPETGSFEEMRHIVLESFVEMVRADYQNHLGIESKYPPPMKVALITDAQGCSVSTCSKPVAWTVDDLNERAPGMFGIAKRRHRNEEPVEFIRKVWDIK